MELTWQGIGPLYRGFFTEREPLTRLARSLSPWLRPPAMIQVGYDSERFVGWIRLQVPPGALRVDLSAEGETLPLQRLAPITRALAAWRAELGARFDLRLLSFQVGVDFLRGPHHCRIRPGGPPPPDGTVVDPCVELDGTRVCGEPTGGEGVRFPPEVASRIAACLSG